MSKTAKAQKIITRLLKRRRVISLGDDIKPAFQGSHLKSYMTLAIWNVVKRGDMSRVGPGIYRRG
jgi:hypothetical protein